MVEFPCPCGQYKFSLPDDMAGGLIQCPRCRRLNDIPLLSDLASIDTDGAYKLEPEPELPPSDEVVAKMSIAFTRSHVDDEGNEIDLRNSWRDQDKIGNPEDKPLALRDEVPADRPKYDPDTGQLIRPIEVKKDDFVDPRTVPTAARAAMPPPIVIDDDHPDFLRVLTIPLQLLRPVNIIVMTFILFGHLFLQFIFGVSATGFFLLTLLFPVVTGLILAHYGNVIDETGPAKRNELPTPLRNLSWHEDTWGPFWRMLVALAVCYGPAWSMLFVYSLPYALRLNIALALALAGTLAVPAALLTSTTSGSMLNLRPDRLIGVMKACGVEYIGSVILWLIVAPLYLVSMYLIYLRTAIFAYEMIVGRVPGRVPLWLSWPAAFGSLIAAIYLMHLFCWHLGMFYRRYHERFPWLYQRYDRDSRTRPVPPRGFAVRRLPKTRRTSAVTPQAGPSGPGSPSARANTRP